MKKILMPKTLTYIEQGHMRHEYETARDIVDRAQKIRDMGYMDAQEAAKERRAKTIMERIEAQCEIIDH